MHDARRVRLSQGIGDLDCVLQGLVQLQPLAADQLVERSTLDVLHGDEVDAIRLIDVVNGDDERRVANRRHDEARRVHDVGFYPDRGSAEPVPELVANAPVRCSEVDPRGSPRHTRGPGAGREAALRALQTAGLSVNLIRDVSPIPHNGCRPPKRRRV